MSVLVFLSALLFLIDDVVVVVVDVVVGIGIVVVVVLSALVSTFVF
jgi:hypothetical protein